MTSPRPDDPGDWLGRLVTALLLAATIGLMLFWPILAG